MFHSDIKIKEGAFILSDAHYSSLRPQLLEFIKDINSKKLHPTQLIFLGDIFDALFGGVSSTIKNNQEIISLLNDISQEIELIYLEGNHDFNLKKIFPSAKVFSISKQPLVCDYKSKKILLAHGDFGSDAGYKIYTYIARNRFVLILLNFINNLFGNFILKKLDRYLSKKNDCKELNNFREYTSKRLESKFDCDYFIEGHFHQNKTIKFKNFVYINLGVFACNQRYFIVKFSKDKELLEEKIYSKEI
ncbi:MAG: metallophosphoesterase [Campylobacterota bacterium]|nr:metallophosphoesterase [Campylobacterota bacterium]